MAKRSPIQPVVWTPRAGKLNRDIDPQDITGGDLSDALNIRATGEGEGVTPDYEIILGNELQYTVSPVVAQNKKFLIAIDTLGSVHSTAITIYDQNNILVGTANFNTGNYATTLTNITTALTSILVSAGNYTLVSTATGANTGTISLEITKDIAGVLLPFNNWTITITNVLIGMTFDVSVTQENIDAGLAGEQHLIGSFNLLGDNFQFWTSQNKDEEEMEVFGVTDNGSGVIRITVTDTTDIVNNSLVVIAGCGGTAPDTADGKWIISVIDGTTFDLLGSTFGASYTLGTATFNTNGIGEIGVAVENINAGTVSYTRLLRSIEFNFRTSWQIDVDGENKGGTVGLYFDDWFNVPRVFYYKGAYITDGAIEAINPEGKYQYGTIGEEIAQILNTTSATLTSQGQAQTGGNLQAGNYRYYAQFLTDTKSPTEWSEPTNCVNVYAADINGPANLLSGSVAGTVTGKINILLLTNIPDNKVYKYARFGYVLEVGSAFEAAIIGDYVLNGNSTQIFQHTGFEQTEQELDAGTLNLKYAMIKAARNTRLLNGRNFKSNIKYFDPLDLTGFFASFEHSIEKESILSVGQEIETGPAPYLRPGEYFLPTYVNGRTSFMMNECVRYMGKARLNKAYGGGMTQTFWIDDILIDCNTYNIDPAYPDNRRVNDGSPTATNYNITTSVAGANSAPYVWFTEFHGIDMNFLINGVPAREIIDEIFIEFVPLGEFKEVMGCGYFVPAVSEAMTDGSHYLFYPPDGGGAYATLGDFPFISGHTFNSYNGFGGEFNPDNPTYTQATTARYIAQLRYGSFYSMDQTYGTVPITWRAGDGLLFFGSPHKSVFYPTSDAATSVFENQYVQNDGATGVTVKPALNVALEGINLAMSEKGVINGLDYNKTLEMDVGGNFQQWTNQASVVVYLTSNYADANTIGNTNYGFAIAQYYRPLSTYNAAYDPDTSKYGSRINSKSVPSGASYKVTAATPPVILHNTIQVFGGECFPQKTWFKFRYPVVNDSGATVDMGFGGGVSFYSINYTNTQMRYKPDTYPDEMYPKRPLFNWLQDEDSDSKGLDPQLNYNSGYNIRNEINVNSAFDPNLPFITSLPNLVIWSQISSPTSLSDPQRQFLPLDSKALEAADGPINHMEVANGFLITMQEFKVQKQYINSSAVISTAEGSEVITGDGGIMTQIGQTMSTYGPDRKWGCGIGKSKGGHDVLYWINSTTGIVMRLGYDGSVPISREHFMRSFFENNLKWTIGKDRPAHDEGIHVVWSDRFSEFIITVRGKKVIEEWNDEDQYESGEVVNLSDSTFFNTFEKFDTIWKVKPGVTPLSGERPDVSSSWELVAVTDNAYYNFYTINFSEVKNGFQCFLTHKPKIYAKMKNYFLSPRPISNVSQVYRHNAGDYCVWYDNDTTSQAENAYFELVINDPPQTQKRFLANRIDSAIAPFKVEDRTEANYTFALASDFQARNGIFDGPTFNDATAGNPKADTSRIYGAYMKKKIFLQYGAYQKVRSAIQKIRVLYRMYNT